MLCFPAPYGIDFEEEFYLSFSWGRMYLKPLEKKNGSY